MVPYHIWMQQKVDLHKPICVLCKPNNHIRVHEYDKYIEWDIRPETT